MDSFEVASQFSTILRNLTPQFQQLAKASYFALKNADKEDYIVPTVLDVVQDPKLDLNTKATIFQFIELLITESHRNQSKFGNAYLQSLKMALPSIITSICPEENSANFQNTYHSLQNISKNYAVDCSEYDDKCSQNLLSEQDLTELDQGETDVSCRMKFEIQEKDDPLVAAWKTLLERKRQTQIQRYKLLNRSEPTEENVDEDQIFNMRTKTENTNHLSLTKKQIISRMEDERESHKRSKENIWCVNRDKSSKFVSEDEFTEYYWDKCQRLDPQENRQFLDNLQELNQMVLRSYKDEQSV
ncbi:uncharacterized protein LODBEIA_P38420 [Lodderomyces beijingensis]|uniref:CID domain-containing protein n=1 Tax=Lodderomyces beijingensis TaxID=1775926 RepID=A0ABP0ZPM2_9ASCO